MVGQKLEIPFSSETVCYPGKVKMKLKPKMKNTELTNIIDFEMLQDPIPYFATFPRRRSGRETHSPRAENTLQSGGYGVYTRLSFMDWCKQWLSRKGISL